MNVHQSKFVTDSRLAPGRSHVTPTALHDAQCRHNAAAELAFLPPLETEDTSRPRTGNRNYTAIFEARVANRSVSRRAPRFPSRFRGCQGLKRIADSIVPFARTTPSKGQLAIVAAAKKHIYKPREIDVRRRPADQTGGSIQKDLCHFHIYIYMVF